MNPKSFVLVLIVIIIVLVGYLIYQKQVNPTPVSTPLLQQTTQPSISPDNNTSREIINDLSSSINPNNISGFEITVRKILDNYATGGAGVSPQAFAWIAVKENGKWTKVWDGVNDPSCSIVNQYNIPKQIYEECSENY